GPRHGQGGPSGGKGRPRRHIQPQRASRNREGCAGANEMATAGTGVGFGTADPLELLAQVLHTPLQPLGEAPCSPGGREYIERIAAPVEVVSGPYVGDEPHSTDVGGKKQRGLGGVLLLPIALITGGAGDAQRKAERPIEQLESHLRASVGQTPAPARDLRHADGAGQLDSLEQAGRT